MHKSELITKAQEYLAAQPIDSAHGLAHHKRVAQNCLAIIEAHKLPVGTDILEVAAWWHDLESQQGATALLTQELSQLGVATPLIEKLAEIVSAHTFGAKPTSLEAQILYDADKMEYFNPERLASALIDAKKGVLAKPTLKKHYLAWLDRYQSVLEILHFEYSRQFALDSLEEAQQIIKEIGEFVDFSRLSR